MAPLEDYSTVEDGKRYHTIAIYLDEFDQWLPEPTPPMPSNHSSRPEWTNRAEFSELAAPKSKRLRFTFELLRRTVEHVPSQHRWRVIYYSKIEEICRP